MKGDHRINYPKILEKRHDIYLRNKYILVETFINLPFFFPLHSFFCGHNSTPSNFIVCFNVLYSINKIIEKERGELNATDVKMVRRFEIIIIQNTWPIHLNYHKDEAGKILYISKLLDLNRNG